MPKNTRKRTITPADLEAAANLKRLWYRAKKGRKFTQTTAAAELGWSSQGTISQYLNGDISLGVAATLKFARFLDCRPTDIRPDYETQLQSGLSQEAVEVAFLWQEIPDPSYRDYFRKLIEGWTDRKAG